MRFVLLALLAVCGLCGACGRPAVRAPDELDTLVRLQAQLAPTDPQRPDVDFRLADALARRHDPREVEAFRAIAEAPQWRTYARRDEVLFWYAHALAAHERSADSLAILEQLLAEYPTSKHRADAVLTLGDAQFERGDLSAALLAYQAATDLPPDDERGWYARYRIAWCHYRLGDAATAEAELLAIAQAPPHRSATREKLIATAGKDLAKLLADDHTYERADAFYAAQQFCDAAPLFATVAQSTAPSRGEAAYAHVLATLSCEHLADGNPDAASGQTPLPLPAAWQHAIAAMDLYLAQVGASDERDTVQFKRARALYAFVHLPEAARGFRGLVHAHDATLALYAAALLLDCDVRGNGPELAADLAAVCALPGAKDSAIAPACPK